ncbi:MAG: hypothetical protein A3G35_06605 [candidate division NC10 bacterium RIFCSPLOWO2_12_FULL_66_18]|nr:MAG: hypothetical protein A3G35_06605 [candidate division NC10 bacterium RIFCSPLOWO2_12_FULL_66_18]
MHLAAWRGIVLALALPAGAFTPAVVLAQAGLYVTPFVSVAEVYDDNLFATPSHREADFISRVSPGIQAGYRTAPLTLEARYSFDAEIYARHPEMNDAQVRQAASLDFRYLPNRALTLSANVVYSETHIPRELNLETGLASGRARASRLSFRPSLAYRFDSRTNGTGGYTVTKDGVIGGIATLTHAITLDFDRRLTARDTGHLGYQLRQSEFDGADTTMSHAFTLGWTRELTPQTSLTLRAGPRFSEGSVDPEVSVSIRHRLQRGDLSLTYSRSQTTAIGQAGTAHTESWTARATVQLMRSLQVSAAPSFLRSTRDIAVAKVYGVNLDAAYQITTWVSLVGSYRFSLQQGRLDAPGRSEDILQNVFLLSLVAVSPSLLD